LLDHMNVAKVSAFGVEDDHFVFVSEYLEGEALDSWIAANGPMALDAVLRIALQVVSALSAASFYELTHRAIRPSNLMIVPGPTAEGGWPFVKLINFGLAGSNADSQGGEAQFVSPEQLQYGTVDFRSEIYSLGATMCFLLTGAAPSAGTIPLQQLSRFPTRVRNLLAQMLRNNPDERPQDPVGFAEEIRECLLRVERRQVLARRFGIPLVSIIPRTSERPHRVPRRALALAALALTLAALAAILLAEPIRTVLHRNRTTKAIGVPIGVPEASPEPIIASRATGQALAASPAPTNATNVLSVQATTPIPNQSVVTSSPTVLLRMLRHPRKALRICRRSKRAHLQSKSFRYKMRMLTPKAHWETPRVSRGQRIRSRRVYRTSRPRRIAAKRKRWLPQQSAAHPPYRNKSASHRSGLTSRRHSRDRCVQVQSAPSFWA